MFNNDKKVAVQLRKARLAALMSMLYFPRHRGYNPPDANDAVIKPPQSEEAKLTALQRAEAKRLRKKEKRCHVGL